jgi:hypothetical protein
LAYFVLGVIMHGGGAIDYGEAGIVTTIADQTDNGEVRASEKAANSVKGVGGAMSTAARLLSGGLTIIWNIISIFTGFLNWPITVLATNNAPPMATLLFGGSLTTAFYISLANMIR